MALTTRQTAEPAPPSEPLARTLLHHLCQHLHLDPASRLEPHGGSEAHVFVTAHIPASLYSFLEAFDADGDPDTEQACDDEGNEPDNEPGNESEPACQPFGWTGNDMVPDRQLETQILIPEYRKCTR